MGKRASVAAAVLAAAALTGCFAEVEDSSVRITRSLPVCDQGVPACSFVGEPALLQQLVLANTAGSTQFTVDVGDSVKSSSTQGPLTVTGKLTLSEVVLVVTTPGVTLSGLDRLELQAVPAGTTCAASSCPAIATYDRATAPPSDGTRLVLQGSGVNILDLASAGKLTVRVVVSGTAPQQNWNADMTLDVGMSVRASM